MNNLGKNLFMENLVKEIKERIEVFTTSRSDNTLQQLNEVKNFLCDAIRYVEKKKRD